jgi:hypothetical protein
MLRSVSLPEPPVACAVLDRQADGDAGGAGQAVGVGDGVGAAAAVEDVVAGTGVEDVVERVAGEVGGSRRENAAVLDVGRQGVGGESAVDGVVPPVLVVALVSLTMSPLSRT